MRTRIADDHPNAQKEVLSCAEETVFVATAAFFNKVGDSLVFRWISAVGLAVTDIWDGEWNGIYPGRLNDRNPGIIFRSFMGQKELGPAAGGYPPDGCG